MKNIETIIKNTIRYVEEENIIHFILDEEARPYWSKQLNQHLVTNKIDLDMSERYKRQKAAAAKDRNLQRFIKFLSEVPGIKIDLASGPSGYFAPVLDKLLENDIFIITDACPSVINAHSAACRQNNCFVFDIDLDNELPFINESIDIFSGNQLNNVNHYAELIREVYRCLKPGGRFAVIEIFFEKGSRTAKHLESRGAITSSFETFVSFCGKVGFKCVDSDILCRRKGKISEGDLYPLVFVSCPFLFINNLTFRHICLKLLCDTYAGKLIKSGKDSSLPLSMSKYSLYKLKFPRH